NGRNQIRDLKRQLSRAKSVTTDGPFDVVAHKSRMAALLPTISSASNPSIVINELKSQGLTVTLSGVSATSGAPAEYVRLLNESFAETGWWATLSGREASFVNGDGGPWTFTVGLSPIADSASVAVVNRGGTQL
ncbi:MAG: hypothetical protein AAGC73_09500, partial [Verrucomicrobiota bacterium]